MAVQDLYVAAGYWAVGYAVGDGWVNPVSDLQAVAPSAIIELFELQLNTAQHGVNDLYKFHAGTSLNNNQDIVWAGNIYTRFPIEADGFEYSGKGTLPRPKIRCSNVFGTITAIIASLPRGLEGAKVTRIRTLARYLDAVNFPGSVNPYGTPDPTSEFPREIFTIDRKTVETRDVVEYELAAAFDLVNVRAPKRQCIANICQWVYRSAECGYAENSYYDANDNPVASSTLDVCGKRLSSCQKRFTAFSADGSVTNGSNQLTLTSAVSAAVGLPISGFGLASGTTVSSVSTSGLIVTMSQNATASSTQTTTGTIQSNQTSLIVTSATNLAKGMTVSGSNIASGTTISAISGTTITLSQKADKIYTLYVSSSGYVYSDRVLVNITGLTVGMIAMGPNLPTDYSATISNVYSSYVKISYDTALFSKQSASGTFSFYTVGSYSSASYTFTGSPTYTFRDSTADSLPFGSFPGIGTYFT